MSTYRGGKLWDGFVLPSHDSVTEVADADCYFFVVTSGTYRGWRFGPRAQDTVFRTSQITCGSCGELGHLRRDCSQSNAAQQRAPPPGSPDSPSPPADTVKEQAHVSLSGTVDHPPALDSCSGHSAGGCTEDPTPELDSCSAGGCSSPHADSLKAPCVMFGPAFGNDPHAPPCLRMAMTAALETSLWKQKTSISWIRFPGRPPGNTVAFLVTQTPACWRMAMTAAWKHSRFPGRPPGGREWTC